MCLSGRRLVAPVLADWSYWLCWLTGVTGCVFKWTETGCSCVGRLELLAVCLSGWRLVAPVLGLLAS